MWFSRQLLAPFQGLLNFSPFFSLTAFVSVVQAFIEDPESLNKELYGDVDKILAAEWAKFRWGVFDDRNKVTPSIEQTNTRLLYFLVSSSHRHVTCLDS